VSIATTYAEALHEAASSQGQVSEVATQLHDLREAVRDVPELSRMLGDPDIDTAAKKRAMASLTEGASPLLANFVQVLLDRGRAEDIDDIGRAFERKVAEADGRLRAVVRTAIPLPDDLRADVKSRIERGAGGPIDIDYVVDESIVGGVVIETETARVDASVRQRLENLRDSMAGTSVQSAIAAE